MRKSFYISLIAFMLMLSGVAMGQNPSPLTVKAYELYQKGEFELASKAIDEAIQEKEGLNDPVTWQLRAFIYFEIYDKVEKRNTSSEARVNALGSTLHSMEIDKDQKNYDQNINLLDRISISYYNDAVNATNNLDPKDPNFAENSFKEYLRIQKIAHPDQDFKNKKVEFYRALATAFGNRYQKDPLNNREYFDLTIEALTNVLQLDSNDYAANYNMSIYYFNEGVYKIDNISSVSSLTDIILIQDQSIQLFKKAEPYMLKAHGIKKREETFRGLRAIYKALSEQEKFEKYDQELETFLDSKK